MHVHSSHTKKKAINSRSSPCSHFDSALGHLPLMTTHAPREDAGRSGVIKFVSRDNESEAAIIPASPTERWSGIDVGKVNARL